VRGRAAEALGLIGDTGSAAAVGQMVSATSSGRHRVDRARRESGRRRRKPTPCGSDCSRSCARKARSRSRPPCRTRRRCPDWWPVAFALQRDQRSARGAGAAAARADAGRLHRAFAARGLGAQKDAASIPLLRRCSSRPKATCSSPSSAIRALAQIGAPDARRARSAVLDGEKTDPNVRLEAVPRSRTLKSEAALPTSRTAHRRLADDARRRRCARGGDRSRRVPHAPVGMEPDQHWGVRAAIADVLGTMPPSRRSSAARDARRQDKRVVPSAIERLARLKAPGSTHCSDAAQGRRHRHPRRRAARIGR
jgi:hypothetical protein